jgi:hypothetical protein
MKRQNTMEYDIRFNPAAFKHGCTEADIRRAIFTKVYDGPILGYDNKYLAIGFDTVGNTLEIMYNDLDGNSINVFHAMKCRNSIVAEIDLTEG